MSGTLSTWTPSSRRRSNFRPQRADTALVMAGKLRGVLSHASAAQVHGWEIAFSSPTPTVTVPRNRMVDDRRDAAYASALAANSFESILRGLALDAGPHVLSQFAIPVADQVLHPDVVAPGLRLVLEADSRPGYTGKETHNRDCWCYPMLVVNGWTLLRFTWEQVMLNPRFVHACLIGWATAIIRGRRRARASASRARSRRVHRQAVRRSTSPDRRSHSLGVRPLPPLAP